MGPFLRGLRYNLQRFLSPRRAFPLGASCSQEGRGPSYHELKEEPGMLQDGLTHSTATDHPLQSQLLVKKLEAGAGVTESRGAYPYPPLEGTTGEDAARGLGVRSAGGHAGKRGQKDSMCPFPMLSRPCWAQGMGTLDPFARTRPKFHHPPSAFHYLLHSGSRLGSWWG